MNIIIAKYCAICEQHNDKSIPSQQHTTQIDTYMYMLNIYVYMQIYSYIYVPFFTRI